ncbi:LLM class flavin-dependent oxidoreductase [Streptomyces sp. VNUA116]|uniref:LLM class flavin-dependent oxidoreductase n=1 Tax=Streptomyces sp. VNUA116 TaxID=3062449 RepID=UPI002677545D|nr:LLM class flavin-dependent oxidoreductase [Streptomyces sp. VNUA116]WKU48903.1 LLM class flavin-dependent oxidoreductase [Streptomyces sp. VNUA116]
MTAAAPRWSVVAPQGAAGELARTGGPEGWQLLLETARTVRRHGRGALWLLDRTDTTPRRAPEPVWEGWTALAGLAAAVPGLELGLLSPAAPFRNAALLAKRAASTDHICGGRLALGLTAAAYVPEHRSTGVAPPDEPADGPSAGGPSPGDERAHRAVGETAEALRALWSGRPVTLAGEHVRLTAAHCVPVPRQDPLPLVLRLDAGEEGAGARLPADAAVRECTAVQWTGETRQVAASVEEFGKRRTALGTDPGGVRHAWAAECRVFGSVLERDRWLCSPHEVQFWSHHPDLLARRSLYGTPDQITDRARSLLAAGVEEFVLWFRDYPDTTSLDRLLTDIASRIDTTAGPAAGTGGAEE